MNEKERAELEKYRTWERNRAESEASLSAQAPCGHPVQLKMGWEDGKVHCWECEWMALRAELDAKHLPDDSDPFTGDWLHFRAGFSLQFHPHGIEPCEYYTMGQLIFDSHEKSWKLGNIELTSVLHTKGDVRQLCRALKFKLPPGN